MQTISEMMVEELAATHSISHDLHTLFPAETCYCFSKTICYTYLQWTKATRGTTYHSVAREGATTMTPQHVGKVRRDPGRPPDDPYFKASRPIRALLSRATEKCVEHSQKMHGLNQTDYVRWLIYKQLREDGLADELDFEKDNTWRELRRMGLV